jgi:PadR family transcriptional regulator, regulatory protein PadR
MGAEKPRLSVQTLKVLAALSGAKTELSGSEIARSTKLASGTLYPILLRLEQAGWVDSRWEEGDPHELGRPRRRFYAITGLGARNAQAAYREVRQAFGGLAWIR